MVDWYSLKRQKRIFSFCDLNWRDKKMIEKHENEICDWSTKSYYTLGTWKCIISIE